MMNGKRSPPLDAARRALLVCLRMAAHRLELRLVYSSFIIPRIHHPHSSSRLSAYRGRFAPSPTGPLHFGSLVAAVGSYLEAHTQNGEWLVRIEDLDRPRVAPGAAQNILRTLESFGMQWHGTVAYQSTRTDAYHAALHELRQRGRVYTCACSRREIADSGISGIEGFVYPATCRDGLPAGRPARAWRVNTAGAVIRFHDAIQGQLEHELEHQI